MVPRKSSGRWSYLTCALRLSRHFWACARASAGGRRSGGDQGGRGARGAAAVAAAARGPAPALHTCTLCIPVLAKVKAHQSKVHQIQLGGARRAWLAQQEVLRLDVAVHVAAPRGVNVVQGGAARGSVRQGRQAARQEPSSGSSATAQRSRLAAQQARAGRQAAHPLACSASRMVSASTATHATYCAVSCCPSWFQMSHRLRAWGGAGGVKAGQGSQGGAAAHPGARRHWRRRRRPEQRPAAGVPPPCTARTWTPAGP